MPVEKRSFLKNTRFLFRAREKILNNFRGKIFPTKNLDKTATPEPEPEPAVFATPKPIKERTNKSTCKLYEDYKFVNDCTNINN